MNIEGTRILAIAPHIDDVELGVGASLHRLSSVNEIYYLGLSLPPLVDRKTFLTEFEASIGFLKIAKPNIILKNYNPRDLFSDRSEILQLFFDLNRQLRPNIVFVPNSKDIHQSHEVVHAEAKRAFKYGTILGYELPWNSMDFSMDLFISLDEIDVNAKLKAINAYTSQKKRMFFANDIMGDLARVRGKQVGLGYAECFEVVRLMI